MCLCVTNKRIRSLSLFLSLFFFGIVQEYARRIFPKFVKKYAKTFFEKVPTSERPIDALGVDATW